VNKEYIEGYLQQEAAGLLISVEEEVTSTNTVLKQVAVQGAPEGTVLLASRQTAGKGRLGRSFYSPEETGIYMSLLLRPKLKAKDSLLITTAAAVAVAEAIEKVTGRKLPYTMGPRRAGDPPSLVADASRAFDVLGWKPEHSSVEEIIRDAWNWYQIDKA